MLRVEKTVFLSYRRTNFPWAVSVFQYLSFHGYDVFLDFDSLGSGDFEKIIRENILYRAHFAPLLTPSALEGCDAPGDWLRFEIETALRSKRNVVPLMQEGFSLGSPSIAAHLTGELAALSRYNSLTIHPESYLRDMETLRTKFLSIPLENVAHPASAAAQKAAAEQQYSAHALEKVSTQKIERQHILEHAFDDAKQMKRPKRYFEMIAERDFQLPLPLDLERDTWAFRNPAFRSCLKRGGSS